MADEYAGLAIGSTPPAPGGALLPDKIEIERGDGAEAAGFHLTLAQIRQIMGGYETGDMLLTTRDPGAGWLLSGAVYSQAAYPELFGVVGLIPDILPGPLYAAVANSGRNVSQYARIDANNLIGVGASGAIWRSGDNGLTWTNTPYGTQAWTGVYVGASAIWIWNAVSLHRSDDGGATFTQVTKPSGTVSRMVESSGRLLMNLVGTGIHTTETPLDNAPTWLLRIGFTGSVAGPWVLGPGILVYMPMGATSQFYRSMNNGQNWQALNWNGGSNYGPTTDVEAAVFPGGIAVVACQGDIRRTTDYGLTWQPVTVPTMSPGGRTHSFIVDERLIVQSVGTLSGQNFLYSDDKGATLLAGDQLGNSSRTVALIDRYGATFMAPAGNVAVRTAYQYSYDSATQFRAPSVGVTGGAKAYIKG